MSFENEIEWLKPRQLFLVLRHLRVPVADLAQALNVSTQRVYTWCNGGIPRRELRRKIARVLEVTEGSLWRLK